MGHEKVADKVFLAGARGAAAASAAMLRGVIRLGLRFDVACIRHRHHAHLGLDQRFVIQVAHITQQFAAARLGIGVIQRGELLAQHREQLIRVLQDADQFFNPLNQIAVFIADFVLLQAG